MTRKKPPYDPRTHSRLVTEGVKQTLSRAMLRAVGYNPHRCAITADRVRLEKPTGLACPSARDPTHDGITSAPIRSRH
jgi:hypothetical protein